MILTKEVEVRPSGKMIQYYKDKGYNVKYRKPLMVKVEDLPNGSDIKLKYLCDYCKEEIISIAYSDYVHRVKETGKMACKKCAAKKREEVLFMRYGVKYYSQTDEHKQKWNKTCTKRYGENFGREFNKRASKSFYEKTGYYYPNQSPEVREKTTRTFYQNGSQKVSRQQFYIYNLYKTNAERNNAETPELNYPISYLNADICFPEEKIDFEVDFGGHNLQVKLGQLTQEEFDQKQLIRDRVVKSEGYKMIRLISTKDLLPHPTVLLEILTQSRQYFSKYPNHSWIEWNVGTSTVRNAEQKDGVFFNFGELYTVTQLENLNPLPA